jgi:hypothetical protein
MTQLEENSGRRAKSAYWFSATDAGSSCTRPVTESVRSTGHPAPAQAWISRRMEAEADLVNFGRKPTLEDEFTRLEGDDEIEKELQALKSAGTKKTEDSPPA